LWLFRSQHAMSRSAPGNRILVETAQAADIAARVRSMLEPRRWTRCARQPVAVARYGGEGELSDRLVQHLTVHCRASLPADAAGAQRQCSWHSANARAGVEDHPVRDERIARKAA